MKALLITFLLFNSVRCTTTTVYICDSPNAIRYHYKANCRDLSNCSHRIIQISLEEAKKSNKTLCHWER